MSTHHLSPILSYSAALPKLGTLQLLILLQEPLDRDPGQPQHQEGSTTVDGISLIGVQTTGDTSWEILQLPRGRAKVE